MDCDVATPRPFPGRPVKEQPDVARWLAAPYSDVVAVLHVAEAAGYRQRRWVVVEGAAGRSPGAEALECRVKDRGAHLLADSTPW